MQAYINIHALKHTHARTYSRAYTFTHTRSHACTYEISFVDWKTNRTDLSKIFLVGIYFNLKVAFFAIFWKKKISIPLTILTNILLLDVYTLFLEKSCLLMGF